MGRVGHDTVDAVRRERGEVVLGTRPAGLLPFAGGDDHQGLFPDAFQCFWRASRHRGSRRPRRGTLVLPRAVTSHASDTESGERGQQPGHSLQDVVEACTAGTLVNCSGDYRVEQRDACDLRRKPLRKPEHVRAAERVTRQHVRGRLARPVQQRAEVSASGTRSLISSRSRSEPSCPHGRRCRPLSGEATAGAIVFHAEELSPSPASSTTVGLPEPLQRR